MDVKSYLFGDLPIGWRDRVTPALDAALLDAREMAYAPYSKYMVGAVVLTADGRINKGCNVETANYDGTHAEESALAAMVMAGRRDPVFCVCYGALEGRAPEVIMSCGKCRQALKEFSSLSGNELWLCSGLKRTPNGGFYTFVKLSDLLPDAFGPADIGVDLAKHRR